MSDIIYLDQAFFLNKTCLRKDPTFVHVGTFSGRLEKKLTELFPTCKIFSIEPHPSNFTNLVQNTSHLKNITRLQKALVSNDETSVFLHGLGSCASTFFSKQKKGIEVPAINLKNLISDQNIDEIDCIFYNAEGSEMQFLPYLINEKLDDKVRQICLNFHTHVKEFQITREKVEDILSFINKNSSYKIIDDRSEKIASTATGNQQLSEKYPCHLFFREN